MEAYQLTKTIRFKLVQHANINNHLFDEKINNLEGIPQEKIFDDNKRLQAYINDLTELLSRLSIKVSAIPEQLKTLLYEEPDNTSFRDKCPEVKYGFLKIYTKHEYDRFYAKEKKNAQNGKTKKIYKITELKLTNIDGEEYNFLENEFTHWFNEWQDISKKLGNSLNKLKNEQFNFDRRTEISFLIRRLNSRMLFPLIRDFILMTDSRTDHLTAMIKAIAEELDQCEKRLMPTQADGLVLARASFNYYTIHKDSKYNDAELSETKQFDDDIVNLSGEAYQKDNPDEAELYRILFDHYFDSKVNSVLNQAKLDGVLYVIDAQLKNNSNIFSNLIVAIDEKLGGITDEIQQKQVALDLKQSDSNKQKIEDRLDVLREVEERLHNDKTVLQNTSFNPSYLAKLSEDSVKKNLVVLDYLYEGMKQYKAREKQCFYQAVQQGKIQFPDLVWHPLFDTITGNEKEKAFEKFLLHSKEIERLSTEINQGKLSREQQKCKAAEKQHQCKLRGQYLTTLNGNRVYFEKYVRFCEVFKQVALERGRIKAKVTALQQEKTDAQRVQFWAVIADKNAAQESEFSILLFPKTLDPNEDAGKTWAQKAYQALSTMDDAKKGDIRLHLFESLTFRALEKLCFSGVSSDPDTNTNSFWPKVKKELGSINHYFSDYSRHDPFNFIDEQQKIRFYQAVLATKHAEEVLHGVDFSSLRQTVIEKDFGTDFNAFREALEKFSYVKHIKISGKGFNKLQTQFQAQIYKIQSSDLTRDPRNTSDYKAHTELWQRFWTEDNANTQYATRLNPEISISYREPKASRVKKYGKGRSRYDEKKYPKNRYLHSQLTLRTTITCNAAKRQLATEFREKETIQQQFERFNRELLRHDANTPIEYVIGIDVGKVDLAAMTLFKATNQRNLDNWPDDKILKINTLQQMQGSVDKFDVWRIKKNPKTSQYDLHKTYHFKTSDESKPRYVIDNPSYFVSERAYQYAFPDGKYAEDFAKYFEKETVSGLDLTIAKVIDDKIISNAALKTYLRLKERDARRLICIIREQHPDAQLEIAEKDNGGVALYFRKDEKCNKDKCHCKSPIYHYNQKYDIPDFTQSYTQQVLERPDKLVLEQIQGQLQKYLDNSNPSLLIEYSKINHLRESIAANMVGVLHHLYQHHRCLIALEHLDQSVIESHRQQFSGYITRFLEWAIYRKFQSTYRVPPNIKDIVNLRGTEVLAGLRQFGMVFWVDKETSKYCPKCGAQNKSNYEANKKNGVFICDSDDCDFDSRDSQKNMGGIDDPDKVAAYNVAKLGYANYARALAHISKDD